MRKPMAGLLWTVIGAGCLIAVSAHAVSYSWAGAATGNWSDTTKWTPPGTNPGDVFPNGGNTFNADTVTINATGGPYTVTVNAVRQIGAVTLDSANATLNASSKLAITSSASFNQGTISGTFSFVAPNETVTIDKSRVTVSGPTTYKFSRYDTISGFDNGGNYTATFDGGNLASTETLDILATDSPYPRGNLNVTTTNGYTNNGVLSVRTTGYDFGYPPGSQGYVTYTVTNGTLTNNGSLIINNGGTTSYQAAAILNANLTNNAGASLTADALLPVERPGRVYLTRAAGTYLNRGTWTVTGAGGMYITGNGVSFTQDGASAQLSAVNSILYLGNTVGVTNTFSLTNGSVQGNFQLHGTNLTLGPNRTVAGPTVWTLARTGEDGNPTGPPYIYYNFTGTLSLDEVRANETLQVLNNNVGGLGYRAYTSITQTGGFVNKGTISIVDNMSYHDNADRSELVISGGTLTNQGQITLQDSSSAADDGSRLTGQVANTAAGTITLNASTNGQTILGTTGNAHTNQGLILVAAGTKNYINGATLANGAGGVIRNNGTSVTLGGTATLDNALGTIQAVEGAGSSTFTVANPLAANTKSGTVLAGGTWRVQSASNATALNVTNGSSWNITQVGTDTVGGTPTSITLDGANASFTQLESGSLNKIGLNGKLTLLNGKTLTVPNLIVAGRLAGNGTVVGNVSLQGGVIAPGASPGTQTITGNMTWGGGSTYEWEVDQVVSGGGDQSALKGVDPGFDFLSISGTLNITATSANPFLLDIAGLAHPSHALGAVTNWNPTFDSSWVIASAAGGITGFNDRSFAFSDADFYSNNSIAGHRFWVAQSGNDILLVYIVPEPATLAMLALAGAGLLSRRRSRAA